MSLERAVPVLQVADVARSIAWYGSALGFSADPFPAQPPYRFAILRRDHTEIMLQLKPDGDAAPSGGPRCAGWAVYLRLAGGQLLTLAAEVQRHTSLLRGPECLPYGQVEFEVADPDGHRLCIAEVLGAEARVPAAR